MRRCGWTGYACALCRVTCWLDLRKAQLEAAAGRKALSDIGPAPAGETTNTKDEGEAA